MNEHQPNSRERTKPPKVTRIDQRIMGIIEGMQREKEKRIRKNNKELFQRNFKEMGLKGRAVVREDEDARKQRFIYSVGGVDHVLFVVDFGVRLDSAEVRRKFANLLVPRS